MEGSGAQMGRDKKEAVLIVAMIVCAIAQAILTYLALTGEGLPLLGT